MCHSPVTSQEPQQIEQQDERRAALRSHRLQQQPSGRQLRGVRGTTLRSVLSTRTVSIEPICQSLCPLLFPRTFCTGTRQLQITLVRVAGGSADDIPRSRPHARRQDASQKSPVAGYKSERIATITDTVVSEPAIASTYALLKMPVHVILFYYNFFNTMLIIKCYF